MLLATNVKVISFTFAFTNVQKFIDDIVLKDEEVVIILRVKLIDRVHSFTDDIVFKFEDETNFYLMEMDSDIYILAFCNNFKYLLTTQFRKMKKS